ncbi:MAG: flavin reductase family protein [Nanoarchaeota archaeon]
MDLPWGSEESAKFITNVGLITSNGPNGQNIMSAEWTHHVSYSPGLIAVCVGQGKATNENIKATKEFGVSIAAVDQNVLASIAGGSSGKNVDKIAVLKALGFKFYKAKKINILMVEGAVLNAECKLVHMAELGDHTMFVGEVLDAKISAKEPIIYHGNKYFKVGDSVEKPQPEELESIKKAVEKFRKT